MGPEASLKIHGVLGASGLVGQHLMNAVSAAGCQAVGTYCSHPVDGLVPLDIRGRRKVEQFFAAHRPPVVYLPASMANVDYCQLHPADTWAVNVQGVANVVQAANAAGAKVVYFSSDYIFDGVNGPYSETDPAQPICEYGRQKLAAEHCVALHAHSYLIVRTTVVYGWERQGKNFVSRLVETLSRGERLRVPADQVGSPTYAPNLAEAVVELGLSAGQGVYHVVGPDRVDRAEFARQAARAFGLSPHLIQPVSTSELGQAAPRPLNAGMRTEKAVAALRTRLVGYKEGLASMASVRVLT